MAAARKSHKARTTVIPWNSVLWIGHVSLAGVNRPTFPLVLVGVLLRRGSLRLSGFKVGMHVCGTVVVHLSGLLAKSMRPYVTGKNVGRVMTWA